MANFCSNCSNRLSPEDDFCSECGQAVTGQAQTNQTVSKSTDIVDRFKHPHAQQHKLRYLNTKHHSEIITTDNQNGEPVVKFRNLHPNAVWLFFIRYIRYTSILVLLLAIVIYLEPIIGLSSLGAYIVVLYIAARINYKNFEFEISPLAFKSVTGIFHKQSVTISYEQIQNINKRRSIIDRILGLAHLEIETSGTGGLTVKTAGGLPTISEGYIPGITTEEADDVMELILARIQEAD